jgi:pyridoxal phosphate enzyme (YggS family)
MPGDKAVYNRDNLNLSDTTNDALLSARERLEQIRARIENACGRVGRDASGVLLIGASKTVATEKLDSFLQSGLNDCGENYIQEGIAKIGVLREKHNAARFHFIGALQSNKAREAVGHFDFIHSVDRPSLMKALNKAAGEKNKIQNVLIQVNLGGEETKGGCAINDVSTLALQVNDCENLKLCGLMCLPPYHENPELVRPYFRTLRSLRDELQSNLQGDNSESTLHLSMGMSNDLEIAIEEGATMVRVGTALFGSRG